MVFFYDFIFHKSEIRTVLLEVGIVLGLLKKPLLKTSKTVLVYSNSLARHFSSMFHAKCLLLRLDISKLCNQVPSLSLSRWRTLTLLKIKIGLVF